MRVTRVLAPNPGIRELEGTNTWIVGDAPAIVVDPGPDDPGHLAEVARTAGSIGAIALTHDHPDHAPGAVPLGAMTGAPVFAARPAEGMERIRDGERVSAGSLVLSVVGTPGHTPDHVAFFDVRTGSLFTGDAVLGRGTSVIDPPEGDLAAYLRSLRRMRELAPRTIYPGTRSGRPARARQARRVPRPSGDARGTGPGRARPTGRARRRSSPPRSTRTTRPRCTSSRRVRSLPTCIKLEVEGRAEKRTKVGVVRWSAIEPRSCERCGRPVRGRVRLCGSCTVAVLQE